MFVRIMRGWVTRWGLVFAIAAAAILSSSDLSAQGWSSNPFDPKFSRPANPPSKPTSESGAAGFAKQNPFQRPNHASSSAATAITGSTLLSTGSLSGALKINTGTLAVGGLTKSAAGTLTLSGSNTYTGTTTVNAGTLQYNTLNMGSNVTTTSCIIDAIAIDYPSILQLNTNQNNTLTINPSLVASAGTTLTTSGCIVLAGNTTSIDNIDSGAILTLNTGNIGLRKLGSGTLSLTNGNSYTLGTAINQGTLTLATGNASSGGVLDVSGNTSTAIPVGILSGLSNLTLNNSGSGCIVLSGTSPIIQFKDTTTLGGVLKISDIATTTAATVQLMTGELQSTGITAGTLTIGAGAKLTIKPSSGGLLLGAGSLSVVPEPSTIVLLFMAALGLLAVRKRLL